MHLERAVRISRNPLSGARFDPCLGAMRWCNGLPKFLGMATEKHKRRPKGSSRSGATAGRAADRRTRTESLPTPTPPTAHGDVAGGSTAAPAPDATDGI